MAQSVLQQTLELLRLHQASHTSVGALYRWRTLVEVVVAAERKSRRSLTDPQWMEHGPLGSPQEAAAAQVDGLAEFLKGQGYTPRMASPLRGLAQWWLRDDGREAEEAYGWERPADQLRHELRRIRGVSLTLADRILLFVGGLPVFPLERGVLRVIARHGWMEVTADYEEWQEFFTRGSREGDWPLAELAGRLVSLGREHCRGSPDCDGCPLAPMLPRSGPVALMDSEEG
ncbi:MAG: hypothetical protein ACKV0T_14190 [Planctomycetales bacterium]